MTVQMFDTKRLAEYEKSDPIDFVVLLDADKTYIRLMAQYADNIVLSGLPPTILIEAGEGKGPTAIEADEPPVDIPGSAGNTVATAACQRLLGEDNDTYLVTIDHAVDSGPWVLRIQNNENNVQSFNGFIAHDSAETRQPWMEPGDMPAFSGTVYIGGLVRTTAGLLIRNRGAMPLKIEGRAGDRIGDSPARIFEMPDGPIGPHRTDTIVIECPPLEPVDSPKIDWYETPLKTNDPYHARTIRLGVKRHVRYPNRCRQCRTCLEFEQGQIPEPWELRPPETQQDFIGVCFCGHREKFHGVYPSDWPQGVVATTRETDTHRAKWSQILADVRLEKEAELVAANALALANAQALQNAHSLTATIRPDCIVKPSATAQYAVEGG